MERRTNNYDVKFGRIRINFDKIEVQPGKYYTRDESDAIFLKVSEITRYIDFNKPDFNPTEELVNVYINGRGYKIPETKIDNDTIKKNSEGQLYADIKQTEYIAGKNITLTDKEGNIKEISAGTDEEVTKELESLRDDLDEVDDYAKGHEKRIEDLEGSKLTESDTITIKTDNSINVDLTIDYNSENKHLSLKDKKGNVVSEIDASVFVKDGMLDSVELYSIGDDTYLRFVFNTTSGKEDINVKVTELIDIYEGQGCIDITDKTVSLKYDSSKLSVNTQGNLTLAEDYLKNISKGTDGTYVTTEISQKSNGNQTIGTSVKVQAISSANEANNGLVEAKDVKEYVTNQINAIPKEKCLPLVDNLDNYECTDGTIVKYNGSDGKYINGWDYKYKKGDDINVEVKEKEELHEVFEGGRYFLDFYDNNKLANEIDDDLYLFKIVNDSYGGQEHNFLYRAGENCVLSTTNGNNYDISEFDDNGLPISITRWSSEVYHGVSEKLKDNVFFSICIGQGRDIYGYYADIKSIIGEYVLFNYGSDGYYAGYPLDRINSISTNNEYDVDSFTFVNIDKREIRVLGGNEISVGTKSQWVQHNAQPDVSGQVSNLETTVATNTQNILSLQSGKQDKITATNKLPYDLLEDTPQIPTVPTKLSEFTDDLSVGKNPTHEHNQYLTSYTETDPTVPSHVKSITQQNITDWTALVDYLTNEVQKNINDAIAKAHTQNTDTMLANGQVKWENNAMNVNSGGIWAKNQITSGGDLAILQGGVFTHKLSEKLNANMLRPYATTEDMLADMANIPNGAWCAIINTHSAGVSAQSDDDYLL